MEELVELERTIREVFERATCDNTFTYGRTGGRRKVVTVRCLRDAHFFIPEINSFACEWCFKEVHHYLKSIPLVTLVEDDRKEPKSSLVQKVKEYLERMEESK